MPHTYEYPRPALTVDCIVFGLDLEEQDLKVLLIRRGLAPFQGKWALPGGFVQVDETIDDAALRELQEETSVCRVFLEQLYTFGAIGRDPRERVVSVAYYALAKLGEHRIHAATDAAEVAWFSIRDVPKLAFDHELILGVALDRLRDNVRNHPGGFDLPSEKLTLTQLQILYEMVLEREIELSRRQRAIKSADEVAAARTEAEAQADWIEPVKGQLGQYRLEQKLGEGGMGTVYRASHAMLRRPTAIKLLLPEKAGEHSLARFEKEVQLTAALSHPNTVTIFDYGRTADGVFYYAMELIDGATVHQIVDITGAQPAARVLHILEQASGAFAEAHGMGLIHRDVKPANIMLRRLHSHGGIGETTKVLDFGLVKEIKDEGGIELTKANTIVGTPHYMSPETFMTPDEVDGRSDLYSLGAVGYFMLTGTHVFRGETVVAICDQHLHATPDNPSERLGSKVPKDLEAIILSCLEKDPAKRPQDALELRSRLQACAEHGQWSTKDASEWWDEYTPALRLGSR